MPSGALWSVHQANHLLLNNNLHHYHYDHNKLDIKTCDKICSLHEYSLVSRNLHALPLEFLVNCARRTLEIISRREISYTCYISKRKSFMKCDGTLVLSLGLDSRRKSGVVSDDIFKLHGRLAAEMLLDWHLSRTAWIMKTRTRTPVSSIMS